VQGTAGSGKTSVALHRIAYLLYHDRKNLNASNVLILSPNGVFSDYISHILPELGEENIREMSFDIFAYKELKGIAADCEEKYDQIERMLKAGAVSDDGTAKEYHYKQSKEFVNELNGLVLELESGLMDFRDIRFKFINKKADEIAELFYYKFPDIPLLSRMETVAEYVIDEAETLNGRNLDELEMAILMETFNRMYRTKDIYRLYGAFLESRDMGTLPDRPPEERKLRYEDVYPVLYLKYRLTANAGRREIKHLIIDEMQDYSYIQYLIISELFHCKMTILGDKFQTMETQKSDVGAFLPKIFGKDIRLLTLDKSYRQTVEIARYAWDILGEDGAELFERHGKEPQISRHISYDEMTEDLARNLEEQTETFETSAVLLMTENEARRLYDRLKERLGESMAVSYMDRNSKEFKKGLVVTTFYLAKGLEFDRVYSVYNEKCGSPLHTQAKYIMATRALHELYVYEYEEN
ncbi:MAG: AAA family ATPase, partial [Alistipes sp.]|nr:AAA family ATPase [Alistipes sp.]